MSKIAVVTDSTAYIPEELKNPYPIFTIPLQVIWGEESQRDGVDITPTEFYTRLKTAKEMPSTSQPSPAAFKDLYQKLLDEDYQIISIHISAKLSGTMDSAIQAQRMLKGAPIELVDSNSTSMAMGFQVLSVARAASQGASLQDCKTIAIQAIPNIGALFMVSTLEFLHRGGRIGGATAFLGTALDLKPILELRDGKIEAVERVRTASKAMDRLLNLFEQRIGDRRPIRMAALNANAQEMAATFLEKARSRFSITEVSEAVIADVSPVVGTHTGPGTLGIAYMTGM